MKRLIRQRVVILWYRKVYNIFLTTENRKDLSPKAIFLCFLAHCLFLLFSNTSYPAPSYGTYLPHMHSWLCGGQGDFIIDRNLDNDEGGTNGNRYFLTGSYGIFKWLSFDGKLGIGNVDWDRNRGDNFHYDTNFAGAYGFRIKGYENERWGVKNVIGFQHISVHPKARNQGGDKNEAVVDEWQVSTVISKEIRNFVPYVGTRYGRYDVIKWTNENDRKRMKSEKNCGVILGIDYWFNKKIKINLEGTFLDGEELAIGISWGF